MVSCATFSSCRTHLRARHTKALLQWKWIKFSLVRRAKERTKARQRARKAVGLECHLVASMVVERIQKAKENKKERKAKANRKENRKAKGYGGNNNVCRLCGQAGHWGNECPNKGNVSQVNLSQAQDQPAGQVVGGDGASTTGSSIPRRASTASTISSQSSSKVRMVKMYNVATPPSESTQLAMS